MKSTIIIEIGTTSKTFLPNLSIIGKTKIVAIKFTKPVDRIAKLIRSSGILALLNI